MVFVAKNFICKNKVLLGVNALKTDFLKSYEHFIQNNFISI